MRKRLCSTWAASGYRDLRLEVSKKGTITLATECPYATEMPDEEAVSEAAGPFDLLFTLKAFKSCRAF